MTDARPQPRLERRGGRGGARDGGKPPPARTPRHAVRGPEERLLDYLRARRLRMTPERRWVLEEVLAREGHFDTEDLLRFLHRRHRPVSRATLYRTLDHLALAGLVKRHRFGPGHAL